MLNAADLINRIEGGKQERLALQLVSMDGGNIQLNAGLELVSKLSLADIDDTDMVILPALWGNPLGVVRQYPALNEWLRIQQEKDTSLCAAGTGSYFLAEAGLLNNKVATTHWYYFDQFSRTYPEVCCSVIALSPRQAISTVPEA